MRFIRWSRKTLVFAALGSLALAVAGIAIAQQTQSNGRPETDRVAATFSAQLEKQVGKTCTGRDGLYTEQVQATYQGVSTGDPRLTGQLTIKSETLVRNTPDGDAPDPSALGTTEGHFTVQQDGRVVSEGQFYGTLEATPPSPSLRVEGFVIGRAKAVPPNSEQFEAGELTGHFRATLDPAGNLVGGNFGGLDTEPSDPAVIQSGSCFGPAEQTSSP